MAERFNAATELAAAGENPAAREAVLVSILNRANDAVVAMQIRINDLEARVRDPPKHEAHRTPLSRIKGFEKLPSFGGKEAEFETWADKVTTFFSDEKGLRHSLKAAAKEPGTIDERFLEELADEVDDDNIDVGWYSQQFANALTLLTTGTPYSIIKNSDGNGFDAWRRLHGLYAAMTPQGKRAILDQLMHYRRAKSYDDVLAVQEEWDALLQRYKEVATEPVPQDVLITGYTNILPEKLAEAMRGLNEDLSTLTEVKAYVLRQVKAHRKPSSYETARPTPMDIGAATAEDSGWMKDVMARIQTEASEHAAHEPEQPSAHDVPDEVMSYLASLVQYNKGKGKGKSGITCHYCGQPGHIKAKCPELDRVMGQWRANKGKGKGSMWGKGQEQWGAGWPGDAVHGGWPQSPPPYTKGWGKQWPSPPWANPKGGYKGWKGQPKGFAGKSGGKGLHWLEEPAWSYEMNSGNPSGMGEQAAFHVEIEDDSATQQCCRNLSSQPVRCSNRFDALEVTDEEYPTLPEATQDTQPRERADGALRLRGKRPLIKGKKVTFSDNIHNNNNNYNDNNSNNNINNNGLDNNKHMNHGRQKSNGNESSNHTNNGFNNCNDNNNKDNSDSHNHTENNNSGNHYNNNYGNHGNQVHVYNNNNNDNHNHTENNNYGNHGNTNYGKHVNNNYGNHGNNDYDNHENNDYGNHGNFICRPCGHELSEQELDNILGNSGADANLGMLTAEEGMELPAFASPTEWKEAVDGWTKVRGIMDSGAAQCVAPPDMAPGAPILPSAGSQRGQNYLAANGDRMPNMGEQKLQIMTADGGSADLGFQITGVTRPLFAVSEIADRGNRVIFGKNGGVIQNLTTGKLTPFPRSGGVYVLDFYLPESVASPNLGFTRQGQM